MPWLLLWEFGEGLVGAVWLVILTTLFVATDRQHNPKVTEEEHLPSLTSPYFALVLADQKIVISVKDVLNELILLNLEKNNENGKAM